jgi:hypothetical protein
MKLSALAKEHTDTAKLERAVWRHMDEMNYMSGDGDSWTLTEVLQGIDIPSQLALCALAGVKANGERLEEKACEGMRYKLKVLTRQACSRDKDGRAINGFDIMPSDGTEIGGPPIRPEWKEQPEAGDVVRVKGNMLEEDPESGAPMNYLVKRNMIARGREIYKYKEYSVDEDGCISVPLEHAAQLLQQNGESIAFPKWKRLNRKTSDGRYDDQRQIYNWHFKEVPRNFKAPVKRGGKKQD